MTKKPKAIALYSGGLDSILAIKLIMDQGVKMIGIRFQTPFIPLKKKCELDQNLKIPIVYKDMTADFMKRLIEPRYGYGKNMNPCIDCRLLMFQKAAQLMKEEGADFIVTGEVLGQRPMTQNKKCLLQIEEESGYGGLIVRPLSALLLPITQPERSGIIDRSKLMDIQGRSRKRQMALAVKWGIEHYPAPAGGCKLTEPGFSRRMKDLLEKGKFTQNDIELLKVGRHFSIDKMIKLVVGRNELENNSINVLANINDFILRSDSHRGPISLIRFYEDVDSQRRDSIINLAAKITARYCDKENPDDPVSIIVWQLGQEIIWKNSVAAFKDKEISCYRFL